MVRVGCNEPDRYFNIHRGLLVEHAPGITFKRDRSSAQWTAKIGTSFKALTSFAQWLYTGEPAKIDFKRVQTEDGQGRGDAEDIEDALAMHALGREVECVGFMDAVLDQLIDQINQSIYTYCVDDIFKAFLNEFEDDSGGGNFAVDYLVHFRRLGCGKKDCKLYAEIEEIDDEDYLKAVARRSLQAKGIEANADISDFQICKLIVVGLSEAKEWADRVSVGIEHPAYPWEEDRCQYHHHTELGLPCYKAKR